MNFVEWVDEILLQEWDPIGIRGVPQFADEYSSYAPDIAELVARNTAPEIIAGHLDLIATRRMGCRADPENTYRVALILLSPKMFERMP